MIALVIVAALLVAGFTALWLWSRRIERDDIDWKAPDRDSSERQAAQLAIALSVNGTYPR